VVIATDAGHLLRIGALLPFLLLVLILVFRPRGLMGTRDT